MASEISDSIHEDLFVRVPTCPVVRKWFLAKFGINESAWCFAQAMGDPFTLLFDAEVDAVAGHSYVVEDLASDHKDFDREKANKLIGTEVSEAPSEPCPNGQSSPVPIDNLSDFDEFDAF